MPTRQRVNHKTAVRNRTTATNNIIKNKNNKKRKAVTEEVQGSSNVTVETDKTISTRNNFNDTADAAAVPDFNSSSNSSNPNDSIQEGDPQYHNNNERDSSNGMEICCSECGHLVPSSNWLLHQATCNRRFHQEHEQKHEHQHTLSLPTAGTVEEEHILHHTTNNTMATIPNDISHHFIAPGDTPLDYHNAPYYNHYEEDQEEDHEDSTYMDDDEEEEDHLDHDDEDDDDDDDRKPSAHQDDTSTAGFNSEFQHLITHDDETHTDDELKLEGRKEHDTKTSSEVIVLHDDESHDDSDDDDDDDDDEEEEEEESDDDDDDDDDEIEWHCPRCTLLNSMKSSHCAACGYTMTTLQPTLPHPTGTFIYHPSMLSQHHQQQQQNDQGIMRSVANNALVGGAIGALSGYTQSSPNRGFLSSAIHGAIGAFGGAVAGALTHAIQSPLRGTSTTRSSRSRPSSRNGGDHGPINSNTNPLSNNNNFTTTTNSNTNTSTTTDNTTTSRRVTRSSSRRANENHPEVEEQENDALRTMAAALGRNYRVHVIQANRSSPGIRIVHTSFFGPESPTSPPSGSHFLRIFPYGLQRGIPNDPNQPRNNEAQGAFFDHIPYESLLELFGDGSVNRGVDEERLESFPIMTITNPDSLPEQHRTCPICLEGYNVGQERRSLPCLHGFHKECIDQWLSSHDTCPICKFDLSS